MQQAHIVSLLEILRYCDNIHLQSLIPQLPSSLLISHNNIPCSSHCAQDAPHLATSKENIAPGAADLHDSVHLSQLEGLPRAGVAEDRGSSLGSLTDDHLVCSVIEIVESSGSDKSSILALCQAQAILRVEGNRIYLFIRIIPANECEK